MSLCARIFCVMFSAVLLLCASASAMTFSDPVKVGSISDTPVNGFFINGAISNNGDRFNPQNFKNERARKYYGKHFNPKQISYGKGVASFGNGSNLLYFHYNGYLEGNDFTNNGSKFGNSNASKAFPFIFAEANCNIYQLPNNQNLGLYLLESPGVAVGRHQYMVLGYRKDGNFVQYIDWSDIVQKYIGEKNYRNGMWHNASCKFYCDNDTFVVSYVIADYYTKTQKTIGEFRFKWDDSAQWFGVEQVVY